MQIELRHRRIEKLAGAFGERLDDARAALRVVASSVNDHVAQAPSDTIGIPIPADELPVLKRGLDQLHRAIQALTKLAYELEAITAGLPDEAQRYYRISQSGRRSLELLRKAIGGDLASIPGLLAEIEGHVARSARILTEGRGWPQQ